MTRDHLLVFLPHLISALKEAGEEKICKVLEALEFSIEKEVSPIDGTNFLDELSLFSKELLTDFSCERELKRDFEKAEKISADLLKTLDMSERMLDSILNNKESQDQKEKEVVWNLLKRHSQKKEEPKIPLELSILFDLTLETTDKKKFC